MERTGHKQHPPDGPLSAGTAADTSVGAEPLPTRGCGGGLTPRASGCNPRTHEEGPRTGTASTPHPRRGRAEPRAPAASRPWQLLSITFPHSTPCVRVRGVCARVLAWARVRRRGHPGRPRALWYQATLRAPRSSRGGQGPVAPEQGRPGRTPPTGLAAPLCGRGSRSTSRVLGHVGLARDARAPPEPGVCCPAPPGQASGPDSRGLEGKAVTNPPSLVPCYQTPSAPR